MASELADDSEMRRDTMITDKARILGSTNTMVMYTVSDKTRWKRQTGKKTTIACLRYHEKLAPHSHRLGFSTGKRTTNCSVGGFSPDL